MANDDDLLAAPPQAKGVRRLNRIPLIVAGVLGAVLLFIFIYSMSTRNDQERSAGNADQPAPANAGAGASTSAVLGTAPHVSVIPSAQDVHHHDDAGDRNHRHRYGERGANQAAAQRAEKSPEEVAAERAWALYREELQERQQAELARYTAAVLSPTQVHWAGETSTGPGSTQTGIGQSLPAGSNGLEGLSKAALEGLGRNAAAAADPNQQAAKAAYLGLPAAPGGQLDDTVVKPASRYEIRAGTIIPATMIDGINSDLPNLITAQVRQNVYDTATGRYLLIPAGSQLLGQYDNSITYGQSRILVVWNRITFPNGDAMNLGKMPGTDVSGYAGFKAQVNNHYFKILEGALAMSILSAGAQLSQPQAQNGQNISAGQTAAAAVGQEVSQVGASMAQRNLGIAPTLTTKPAYMFDILISKDLVFPGPYHRRNMVAAPVRYTPPDNYRHHLLGWRVVSAVPGRAWVIAPGRLNPMEIDAGRSYPELGLVASVKGEPDGGWLISTARGWLMGSGAGQAH